MTDDDYSPAQIMAAISAAMKAHDMQAVVDLLHMLAVRDPASAELLLAAIDLTSPASPAPVTPRAKAPHSSPASDGPGETVPGAGEHGGHPEAPSPVSGGPSSGGAA